MDKYQDYIALSQKNLLEIVKELEAQVAELNKENEKILGWIARAMIKGCCEEAITIDALSKIQTKRDLEKMALGIDASISSYERDSMNLVKGHLEHGILGKRPVNNPDLIPISLLKRNSETLKKQASEI